MKKIVSIILALVLAASLLCVSVGAEESYPQPEGGKKFESSWAIFGVTVDIVYEEMGYRVYIKSTDPYTLEGEEWEYSCAYNEEQDALLSIASSKNSYTTDKATGDITRGEYEYQGMDDEGQTTVFTINENGELTWHDGRGQDGIDLVFTKIGDFTGFWKSEDGKTNAEFEWSDSELDDNYGYNVFVHDEGEDSYAEYSAHGLYDPETGKLTVTGDVTIYRLNEKGEYDMEQIPANPDDPVELIFSELGNGKILLERENGIELVYDVMGSDSQG